LAKDAATKHKDGGIYFAYTKSGSTQMLCVVQSLLETWRFKFLDGLRGGAGDRKGNRLRDIFKYRFGKLN